MALLLPLALASPASEKRQAYGAYHPAPQPHYGYEHPKHNCSISDVVEQAQVCTPTLKTKCSPVELDIKRVLDTEQCYTVTRTLCSESTQTVDNQVCTYSYQPRTQQTTAKTAEVSFEKQCKTQMVTVCQPAQYGYGHPHGYGENLCKEVAQETCYNVPVVTIVEPVVELVFPEPVKTCANKPISLPRISCEDVSVEKCITVPKVEDDTEEVDKCITVLGTPACQGVELTLPRQSCVELVYGYAQTVGQEEQPQAYPH